jgi:hypothetical protein
MLSNSLLKVKVILRPTLCRSVHLGIRHPPGTRDQFFPILDFFWTFSGLLMWGALSNEKSDQYFTDFAGHRQRSPTGLMSTVYCLYF